MWGRRLPRHSPPPYGLLRLPGGGGQVQVVGPGGSPVCVPPTRYVRPCSRFPPQAAVGPYPSPAVPPYTPPPSCPPRSRPALCPPPPPPPALFPVSPPGLDPLCLFHRVPVPTRSLSPGSRSASRGHCPGMERCAEPARVVVRRAGSAGGARENPREGSPG